MLHSKNDLRRLEREFLYTKLKTSPISHQLGHFSTFGCIGDPWCWWHIQLYYQLGIKDPILYRRLNN